MYERYSQEARRAIWFARFEALHRDRESISVEDVLLGLTWDTNTRVARAAGLKSLAASLRSAVRIPLLPSTAFPYQRKKDIPLENDAKKVLAYTAQEADSEGEFWIDTDHLLRGILRFPNDTASVLNDFGITLQQVRNVAAHDRKEYPPETAPRWGKVKFVISRYRTALTWVALVLVILTIILMLRFLGPVT